MDRKIQELLPWYVNDTLSEDERAEVERALEQNPDYGQEVAFYSDVRETLRANVAEVPDTLTAEALLKQIRPTLMERIAALISRRDGRDWRPQLAFGLGAVIVVQAAIIAYMGVEHRDVYTEVRSPAKVAPLTGPFVRVSFRPEARESDIRFLLTGLGATIVGGPSQLGDYFLFLAPDRTDWASQQLRQSPIVDAVNIIAMLPPAKE